MTAISDQHWRCLCDRIGAYLKRRVFDPIRAEDLLQETLLRIAKQERSIGSIRNVEAWAIRIARNVLVDDLRKNKAKLEEFVDQIPSEEEREEANYNSDVGRWLVGYISELPEAYGEAVRLVDLEGIPQKEAAKRIGISYSGFKSRVQRGRAMIKELIQGCCRLELDARGNVVNYTSRNRERCSC